MATPLPVECFLALASFLSADGRVQANETQAFRRAAREYGLSDEDVSSIEARASAGLTLSEIDLPTLSTWQSALTYSFAVWVSKVDGIVSKDELALLREFGDKLGLDQLRRDAARSATYDIAALPGGHKPDLYDFAKLEAALEAKLPGSFRQHSAS